MAMTAQILDGKTLAQKIQSQLKEKIQSKIEKIGRPPGLAVLMVGDNPASAVYVRNKEKACRKVGIASFGGHFPLKLLKQNWNKLLSNLIKTIGLMAF